MTEIDREAPAVTKVVVIGAGMVGTRFVEELQSRDSAARFDVTVLGAEVYEPYNRVLLSDLVAGKLSSAALALPTAPDRAPSSPHGGGSLTTYRGTSVVELDRTAQVVVTADGTCHPYDLLVLATGSRARIPEIPGLLLDDPHRTGGHASLPRGVHALRTLDDAREIVAATMNAATAVVLGGGVLGLEVATGLARRGVPTTIVHPATALMERQLDTAASAVVADALSLVGVDTRLATGTTRVVRAAGRIVGLRLTDGTFLSADLLVVACGANPETDLAAGAGLDVDRGVLVGRGLATLSDPRVFAIGDCAQPPEGSHGLIGQGWEQARRLATAFTTPDIAVTAPKVVTPEPEPDRSDVVRLKASGLDVVAMGVNGVGATIPEHFRVIRLSDPQQRRLVEVVVDGDRLVGATCVGAGQVAADLTVAYTRGTQVPSDPAHLLLRPVARTPEAATSPTNMPADTTVCRCNGVTKRDIVTCWSEGATSVEAVASATRATTGCGGCTDVVSGIVEWLKSSDPQRPRETSSQAARQPREPLVTAWKHQADDLETSAG